MKHENEKEAEENELCEKESKEKVAISGEKFEELQRFGMEMMNKREREREAEKKVSKNFIVVIIIIKRIIIFVKYNNLMPTYLEKPFWAEPISVIWV